MLLAGYFILWFVKSILGSNRELHVCGRACRMQDQTHHMRLMKKVVAANVNDWLCIIWLSVGLELSVFRVSWEADLTHPYAANLTSGTTQHPLRAE